MTAFQSGLVVMTCAAGDLTMKFFSVRSLRRLGYRRTLVGNGVFAALTILACALFTPATPLYLIVAVLMLHGASRSLQFGSINSLAYVDVPPERMSSATSIAITLQQLMWGVGIAFGAIALHLGAFVRGDDRLFAIGDFQVAFVLAAVVALSSAIISLQLDPAAGAHASGHQPNERAGVAVAKSGPASF
jgi:MFS family permease